MKPEPAERIATAELCVFVYGTLKPGGRYYQRYCGVYLPTAIPAAMRGQLFDFPHLGYPGMTVGNDWVQGYLLVFSQPPSLCSQILSQLDRLEGYQPSLATSDNDYERCWLDVFDRHYQLLKQAWVYRMTLSTVVAEGGVLVSGGNWAIS